MILGHPALIGPEARPWRRLSAHKRGHLTYLSIIIYLLVEHVLR
jgi:hypothetical protein